MSRQFLVLVGSRVLAAALQAVSFVLLSRTTSVELFGLVGVILSIGGFVLLVTDFGMTALLSRSRADADSGIVAAALQFNDLNTLLVGTVGATATLLLSAEVGKAGLPLALLCLSLSLERNSETQLSVAYADGKRLLPAVSIGGRRALGLLVMILLLWLGSEGLLAFCLGHLAGNVFSQIAQRRVLSDARRNASKPELFPLLSSAWPFWLSSVLNQVRVLDNAIVGAFVSPFAAGLYSASLKLTNPLMLIPVSMAQVVLPHAGRRKADADVIALKLTAIFAASYVLIAPVCLLAPELMRVLFGAAYGQASPILVWLLIGLPMVALSSPLAALLQGIGEERFVALNGGLFAVLVISGMVAGALVAGAQGVVIAAAISSILRIPSLLLRVRQKARSSRRVTD